MPAPSGQESITAPAVATDLTRQELPYRLRQQSLLGEFGRSALQTRDIEQILQRATELASAYVRREQGSDQNKLNPRVVMMLDSIAARIARMRAENRNQPGDYSADQRQKHDCLDHRRASLRMISGQAKSFVRENRNPPIGSWPDGMLFRIMR